MLTAEGSSLLVMGAGPTTKGRSYWLVEELWARACLQIYLSIQSPPPAKKKERGSGEKKKIL